MKAMKPQRKLLIKVISDKILKNEIYIHCEACDNPIPADGTGGKVPRIRVIESECLAIGSSCRICNEEPEEGPPLEFCPKCSSDEVVAEHLVKYWRDLCFPQVKNIGSIEFEFLNKGDSWPKAKADKPKPKPKKSKMMKFYMVGIHEHHISWRLVKAPAGVDKEAILYEANFAKEDRLEFADTIDVPPEIIEEK